MKIMLTVSCLEWLTCLLLFTMVEFEKLRSRFKNSTHFSCYESLSKGYNVQMSMCNSHMRCYVTQWSCSNNVVASTVCTDTLSQEKTSALSNQKLCKNDSKLKRGTKAFDLIGIYISVGVTRHLCLQRSVQNFFHRFQKLRTCFKLQA